MTERFGRSVSGRRGVKRALNLFYDGTEQRGSDCLGCDTGRRTRQEGSDRQRKGESSWA